MTPNLAPTVEEGRKRFLLNTILETLKVMGYKHFKARLPGYQAPAVIQGSCEDIRPDILCRYKQQNVIVDVVMGADVIDWQIMGRLSLLASASERADIELHFAVPNAIVKSKGETVGNLLRIKLARLRCVPSRIWEV